MTDYIYARTSTTEQNVDQQAQNLLAKHSHVLSGNVYSEQLSGTNMDRGILKELLATVVSGDCIIVWDLSRLNRNTADFLLLLKDLEQRNVGLIIQSMGGQPVDSRSATGKMLLTVLAAVDQMQVEMMKEKQAIGIARARKEGLLKGRPVSPRTVKACEAAWKDHAINNLSKDKAAKANGVGIATFYRWIKANKDVSSCRNTYFAKSTVCAHEI